MFIQMTIESETVAITDEFVVNDPCTKSKKRARLHPQELAISGRYYTTITYLFNLTRWSRVLRNTAASLCGRVCAIGL